MARCIRIGAQHTGLPKEGLRNLMVQIATAVVRDGFAMTPKGCGAEGSVEEVQIAASLRSSQ